MVSWEAALDVTLYFLALLAFVCLLFYILILQQRRAARKIQRGLEDLRSTFHQITDNTFNDITFEIENIRDELDYVKEVVSKLIRESDNFVVQQNLQASLESLQVQLHNSLQRERMYSPTFEDLYSAFSQIAQIQRESTSAAFALQQDLYSAIESLKPQIVNRIHDTIRELPTFRDIYNNTLQITQAQESIQGLTLDIGRVVRAYQIQRQIQNTFEARLSQLQRILDSAQSRGAFGEYIVAQQLKFLPPEWVATNVDFPNRTHVEFAIRTPTGQLIPIDSKWTGTELLVALDQARELTEKNEIIKKIQRETYQRALETLKYRDDFRTVGFCIAAVPDRVFECSQKIQPTLIKLNVVLISYSMLIPYVLIIINFLLSNARGLRAIESSSIIQQTLLEIENLQEHIDVKVRSKLDSIKLQQVQHRNRDQEMLGMIEKITRMQEDLSEIQSRLSDSASSVDISELSDTPNNIQYRLRSIRETLLGAREQE